jgi:lysozyme family protein
MRFERAVEIILQHEGGYVQHPSDPGGETNHGITKKFYPHLDIKNLTIEQAKEIYYQDYWDKLDLHLLPDGLNLMVFDCAVNQGPPTAIRFLQLAIGGKQSGKISLDDLEAIEEIGTRRVLETYINIRKQRYQINPNFRVFGTGWLSRLLDIAVKSLVNCRGLQ